MHLKGDDKIRHLRRARCACKAVRDEINCRKLNRFQSP